MALNFPNASRSYDPGRHLVRFWGYDGALEILYFVEVGALYKLAPRTRNAEAGYLEAFDSARTRIHDTARRVYRRSRKGPYLLTAADF